MRVAIGIALLSTCGCLSSTQVSGSRLDSSVLWPAADNAPANGQASVPVHVQLWLDGRVPAAGQQVRLSAAHCTVTQPSAVTDAQGHTQGSVQCALPQQAQVAAAVVLGDAQILLPRSAIVNFYPPADGNNAVSPGEALNLGATVLDANGNLDVAYQGSVQFTSTDPNASLPGAAKLGSADRGRKLWANGLSLHTPGPQTVRTVDSATQRVLQTQSFVVAQASATLQLTGLPSSASAGQALTVEVSALGADGSVPPSYRGLVTFFSDDPQAQVPAPYVFTAADAGSHTFSVTFLTAGTFSLAVGDDAGLASTRQRVQVTPGAVQGLQLSAPARCAVGQPCAITVQARDAWGNRVVAYAGTVRLPGAAAHTFTAADQGRSVFEVSFTVAGVQTVTASDTAQNSGSTQVAVDPGPAVTLSLDSNATPVAGQAQDVVVQALDAAGNLATQYTGTVVVGSTDGSATYPGSYQFLGTDQGQHAFAASLVWSTAGAQTLRATDATNPSLNGNLPVTVNHAALAALRVLGSSTAVAGAAQDATVRAEDAYGNTVPSYTGTVQFSSDISANLPGATAFDPSDNGVHTVHGVVYQTAGSAHLSASDTQNANLSSTPLSVQVAPGPVTGLRLGGVPGTAVLTQPMDLTVRAVDTYGNTAIAYRGTVTVTSSDPNASLVAPYTFRPNDAGSVTLVRGARLRSLGDYNVVINDGTFGDSANVHVQHGCYGYANNTMVPQSGHNAGCGGFVGVEIDSQSNPWAAYGYYVGYTLMVRFDGNAWQIPSPASDDTFGIDPRFINIPLAMATDNQGAASLLYLGNGHNMMARVDMNNTISAYGPSMNADTGFSNGGGFSLSALAIGPTGLPTVAWVDGDVHLLTFDGNSWGPIGGNEVITATGASNTAPALALSASGTPFVVWSDTRTGNLDVHLITYNGSSWIGLAGSQNGGGLSANSGVSTDAVVGVDNAGLPWVAWDDDTSGNPEIYVVHYNGSAWTELAGSGHGGGISNTSSRSLNPRLRFDSGHAPWVLWGEDLGGGTFAYLLRWGGTAWAEPIPGAATSYGLVPYAGGGPMFALDANDAPIIGSPACQANVCSMH